MIRGAMLTSIALLLLPETLFAESTAAPPANFVTEKFTHNHTWVSTKKLTPAPAKCPVGTYRVGDRCGECPTNTYSDVEDATECTRCPEGMLSETGSTSASDCVAVLDCPGTKIRCLDGIQCIDDFRLCDGVAHCNDASDELAESCQGLVCPEGTTHCADGITCISVRGNCDGIRYCPDGSDESDETCGNLECAQGQTPCGDNSKCINKFKLCDNRVDCDDGSDELESMCLGYECPPLKFKCLNGVQCVMRTKLCDGRTQCTDGSDEVEKNCQLWIDLVPGEGGVEIETGRGTGVRTGVGGPGPCLAGAYLEDEICQLCPENTFSLNHATSCTSCPDGYVSEAGAMSEDDCVLAPCSAGDYMTDSGCQQCGENTFSGDGASSCTSCPDGKVSAAGSASEDDCNHEVRPTCNCMTPECDYCKSMECAIQQDLINSEEGIIVTSHVTWNSFNTIIFYDENGKIISKLQWNMRQIILAGCAKCKTPLALKEAVKGEDMSTWAFSFKDAYFTVKIGGEVLYEQQLPKECADIYTRLKIYSFYQMSCENTYSFITGEMEAGERMTPDCGGSCPPEA